MSGTTCVGQPRRRSAYLSESSPGAHSDRMVKLFHLATFVEGIINDFLILRANIHRKVVAVNLHGDLRDS
jgi:hypothetical protein